MTVKAVRQAPWSVSPMLRAGRTRLSSSCLHGDDLNDRHLGRQVGIRKKITGALRNRPPGPSCRVMAHTKSAGRARKLAADRARIIQFITRTRGPEITEALEKEPLALFFSTIPVLVSLWRIYLDAEALGAPVQVKEEYNDQINLLLQNLSDCCPEFENDPQGLIEWIVGVLNKGDQAKAPLFVNMSGPRGSA